MTITPDDVRVFNSEPGADVIRLPDEAAARIAAILSRHRSEGHRTMEPVPGPVDEDSEPRQGTAASA